MAMHGETTTATATQTEDEEEDSMQPKHKNNDNASSSSSCRYSCLQLVHQNPTILWVPLLLFAALVAAGLTIVYSTVESQQEILRNEALELAQETGEWFSSQLDAAILPLFSLAQFATELDIFANLPNRIGPMGAPDSLPFLPPTTTTANGDDAANNADVVPTHRNVTGVCTEPLLVQRFDQIASTIKRNAGMEGVLVNLQLAPEAVVCLVHPLNNTQDFGNDDIYMDNTAAIGHDLLNDPARTFIAQATVAADSVIIAGPLTLVQCSSSTAKNYCDPIIEKGFIARLPITSTNGHEISIDGVSYKRWGFAVAIINWMALVERSNIYNNFAERGLTFSLTRTDYIPIVGSNDSQEHEEKVHVLAQAPNWQQEDDGGNKKSKWKTVAVALETTNNEWYMTVGYQNVKNTGQIMATMAVIFVSILLSTLLYVVLVQKQAHSNSNKEQAARLVQTAQDNMAAERDLNDYIAHEVRNPLSAAIAASSFVTAAVDKIMSTTTNNTTAALQREERTQLLLLEPQQQQQQQELAHTVQAIREDMIIVDQSLHFINELLKSMLDMHKVASSQIRLSVDTLSVRDDVFLPVQGMLYQRDETFEIQIDCPADLVIVGDRLRLQQVVMNLARNATKFVQRGYIRLRATVIVTTTTNHGNDTKENVVLHVEDSGPGIPMDKRSNLFQRFQESLDSLNQGTGVGLYLCKKLVDLMEGDIYLDESFDSGVEGFPGTRIVVNLPMTRPVTCTSSVGSSFFFLDEPSSTDSLTPALPPTARPEQPSRTKKTDMPSSSTTSVEGSGGRYGISAEIAQSWEGGEGKCKNEAVAPITTTTTTTGAAVVQETAPPLPETINVLFVDDDRTLRKLARRCLARLVPSWNVWEASSGEMALSMMTSKDEPVAFDIVFMDQYMTTSAGQALKGTETTRQLRALGFHSPIVCGLSANYDSKGPFLNCGADDFWLKPFPCKLPELQRSLQNLIALREEAPASKA